MRHGVIIYDSWAELIDKLSNPKAGELIKMILAYSFNKEVISSEDDTINAIFSMIRVKLDEDADAWESARQKRSEGGKKGMESRWHNKDITSDKSVITPNKSVKDTLTPVTISTSISTSISKDKEKDKKESHGFIKPTVDEISAYCKERGNGIDAQTFFDFYESKGWMIGKNHMKDWKACVRTWERKDTDKAKKNKFNQFKQNEYDFDELEAQLIAN